MPVGLEGLMSTHLEPGPPEHIDHQGVKHSEKDWLLQYLERALADG